MRVDSVSSQGLNVATARAAFENAAALELPEPSGIGRGIVICGGGLKYFTCAWVCINRLRALGCQLPIEFWHLGEAELDREMRLLLSPLDVRFVDALRVRETHPARILNGWELKPYSIIHCGFEEVLLLDADNAPIVDPTFLFETPQYHACRAIFWPDFGRLGRTREIWKLTGVPYRDEAEFETGQIVLDKRAVFSPLRLTMWMNEYSDFWYQYIHGDKETFHIAWRKLRVEYAMPSRGILPLTGTMCQHDFAGRRIFQHRNHAKWSLDGPNQNVQGFVDEAECLAHLNQLRDVWTQREVPVRGR